MSGARQKLKPVLEELEKAPVRVTFEAWPDICKYKATVTRNGKSEDLTVSAPLIRLILSMVRG